MGEELKLGILWVALTFPLLLALGEPQVPCYFIFGDSLVDNGNNNGLFTFAKANYPPYGVDFQGGRPTGRFSNGRNVVDIIAELLGFDRPIPPYASARGQAIVLKGVNYGSGSAGIRQETGQHLGDRISLDEQLKNHKDAVSQLINLLGNKNLAHEHLNECLYTVGIGNNDYINNYFMPEYYPSSKLFTPEQYSSVLIQQYSQQLRTLYGYGARKIGVFSVGQLGCIPAERSKYKTNGTCVKELNNAVLVFDKMLERLVDDFNSNLTDAKFVYIRNSMSILSSKALSSRIRITDATCCKVSRDSGSKGQCLPQLSPCENRDEYYFWDAFHPTEAASILSANGAYGALTPLLSSSLISADATIAESAAT